MTVRRVANENPSHPSTYVQMRTVLIHLVLSEKFQGTPARHMARGDMVVAATHICVSSQNALNDN